MPERWGEREALTVAPTQLVHSQPPEELDHALVAELVEDIKARGIQEPLLVRRRGEHLEIVDGHHRVTAAIVLGLALVDAELISTEEATYLDELRGDRREVTKVADKKLRTMHVTLRCEIEVEVNLPMVREKMSGTDTEIAKAYAENAMFQHLGYLNDDFDAGDGDLISGSILSTKALKTRPGEEQDEDEDEEDGYSND